MRKNINEFVESLELFDDDGKKLSEEKREKFLNLIKNSISEKPNEIENLIVGFSFEEFSEFAEKCNKKLSVFEINIDSEKDFSCGDLSKDLYWISNTGKSESSILDMMSIYKAIKEKTSAKLIYTMRVDESIEKNFNIVLFSKF